MGELQLLILVNTNFGNRMKMFIILFLVVQFSLAQKDNKLKYKGTAFYLESINKLTHKVVARISRGNDLNITYDTFFKSWSIAYTSEDGRKLHQVLKYLNDSEGGLQYMMDGEGHKWYVSNEIDKIGLLLCVGIDEIKPGFIMGYSFENLKPVK